MEKKIIAIVAIFAAGTILFASDYIFEIGEPLPGRGSSISLPSFSLPFLKILPANDAVVNAEAWIVFETYLEFARTHNLDGVKSLSYQISAACQDLARESECLTLMDSVYAFGSTLKKEDFNHVYYDNRQVILSTDAPAVAILYFTRDEKGVLKMLGLRFCFEDENAPGSCARNMTKNDTDGNGWWDSTESLFTHN